MGWDWYQYLNPVDKLIKDATKVKAPKDRKLEDEIRKILGLGGDLYEDAAKWSPQYTDLAASNAARAGGALAGTYDSLSNQAAGTNQSLLSKYGVGTVDGLRAMNPGQTDLYDMLTRSASEGLAAGSRMTPDQMAAVRQPIRGDWAARGFSGDALPGQLDEAVAMARAGDNVLAQRQQTAASVADLGNQFYTQPAANVALSAGGMNAGSLLGMGSGMGGTAGTFEQLGAYGSDVANTNYNAKAAANIATANNRTGMMSSMMSY